jgi:predicted nicotinamide N-methyase
MRAGATHATAADIDPFAVAAIALNARANGTRVSVVRPRRARRGSPGGGRRPGGDCWYETALAERATAWLRRVHAAGIEVLLGDPGRRYLPIESLVELASYDVRTTTVLEDLEHKQGYVFALRDD